VNPEQHCLNCGSPDASVFLKAIDIFGDTHEYYRCNECQLVYLWPLPDEAHLKQVYNSDYYGVGEKEKFSSGMIVRVIDRFAGRRAKRFARYLKGGARIMDVGCGNGRFLEHLHSLKRNFELNGIEIDPGAALRASKRLKARAWIHTVTDIEKFFGKQSFDALSYVHVFEHIQNPALVMDQFEKVLRPGGSVLIVIPNIESLQAKEYKHNWFHLDPPRHLHFYPPGLLIKEMEKRGFHSEYIRYFDPEQNPYGELQSMLNLLLKKRDVLYERLKGNFEYAPEYGRMSVFLMKLLFLLLMPLCILGDIIAAKRKNSATVEILFRKSPAEEKITLNHLPR